MKKKKSQKIRKQKKAQKSRQKIKRPRNNTRLRITQAKIRKLLDFNHLEELYHVLTLLNEKQKDYFISHCKSPGIKIKDQKISLLIKSSKTSAELMSSINKELANSLKEEYEKLQEEISRRRKKGEDMFIEEIKAMAIPAKIKLFTATANKQDFYKIKKLLSSMMETLKEKPITNKK